MNNEIDHDLIVFAANDFGQPRAYRPDDVGIEVQDEIRQAILQNKYDGTNEDLNEIQSELLDTHSGIHKIIAAERSGQHIKYHLPEGSNETTNFLTVREMIGLIDYTTNSFQSNGLCVTY